MPWLQLHLESDRNQAEEVENSLLSCGAVSVTLTDSADDPILEPGVGETPLWETIKITALFDINASSPEISAQLQAINPNTALTLTWETLEDQLWERTWMEDFKPIQCGQRLWVCPSWLEPPHPEAINLRLDPGLAFGSGTHPTTFLCLQWLDTIDLSGKTVIDYGCGSGILGIAALLLGAQHLIALDNDPQALIATEDNLERNGLDKSLLTICAPGQLPPVQADIMVANILASPLIELAPIIGGHTQEGGLLCLSGITSEQASTVMSAYPAFNFQPPIADQEWIRLNATKARS